MSRPYKPSNNYVAQAKILRVLLLIEQLRNKPMTIEQIAKRYDISDRTIYRYIHLIEEIGIFIDRNFYGEFFIFQMPSTNKMRSMLKYCRKKSA